jgi:hypothetical protein
MTASITYPPLLNSSRWPSCSGTRIACHTFVTAAHCVCPGDTTCNPTRAELQPTSPLSHRQINVPPFAAMRQGFVFPAHSSPPAVKRTASGTPPASDHAVWSAFLDLNRTASAVPGAGMIRLCRPAGCGAVRARHFQRLGVIFQSASPAGMVRRDRPSNPRISMLLEALLDIEL